MKIRQENKGHSHTIKHRGNYKIRTLKESEQVMDTHTLSSIKGRTSQNTEQMQASKEHSHPINHKGEGQVM